ncbi:hypothetical protein E2C01_086487 [Portunus trituberculatus]|uniref:Uncharacterized protein n=1 Tax=Portunus trituberculatus TaxID=210409 RepID=A0A5B7J9E8_PORTR|nr:hypothetical protein [Portunus trituberculatus]
MLRSTLPKLSYLRVAGSRRDDEGPCAERDCEAVRGEKKKEEEKEEEEEGGGGGGRRSQTCSIVEVVDVVVVVVELVVVVVVVVVRASRVKEKNPSVFRCL